MQYIHAQRCSVGFYSDPKCPGSACSDANLCVEEDEASDMLPGLELLELLQGECARDSREGGQHATKLAHLLRQLYK